MSYAFKEYLLDADRRELRRGAALVAAEPQTFDLLLYLIQNRQRVVSKDDLMAAYQDRIKAVIAEHDGFIGKFLGDEVVVYFGYPRAREDDAERAVRAGLAVIKTVAALRPRSQKPPQARVAIATGLAVVGDLNEL